MNILSIVLTSTLQISKFRQFLKDKSSQFDSFSDMQVLKTVLCPIIMVPFTFTDQELDRELSHWYLYHNFLYVYMKTFFTISPIFK